MDAQRTEQPLYIDTAIGNIAGTSITWQVIQFIDIERTAQKVAQQFIIGRQKFRFGGINKICYSFGREVIISLKNSGYLTVFNDRTSYLFMGNNGIAQLFDGVRKRIMPDIVQQGRHHQSLYTADRHTSQTTICPSLLQGAQCSYREMVAAQAMFVAGVRGSRPDTIDKA